MTNVSLIGVGLYTASEAARLLHVSAAKVRRWLIGHRVGERHYDPLWTPQIRLAEGETYLGFRDLMELRTALLFMEVGLSAQAIRRAIVLAREVVDDERPLSTARLKTDGKSVFLQLKDDSDAVGMLDLFRNQHVFRSIVERSFRGVDFENEAPRRWWIGSRRAGIVVDPARSFGQPIDDETGVPTAILANAVRVAGSDDAAAKDWDVSPAVVRRARRFEDGLDRQAA